ncbi:MAG TPA: FAD-binding domain-containing protein [Oleiagrimonas sp.]|nr:FAD-binding domain-containing protein [Oleiagrimonas sp.]
MFNPYTQARKFDPDGIYLKRWLPELADVPLKLLHEPDRDRSALAARGYPAPLADSGASRKDALAAWEKVRGN